VEELIKDCEVDEDEKGVLSRELNKRIEDADARVKRKLDEIRDETNEDLKLIVADHLKWSQLYKEMKYKATQDEKIKKKMTRTTVVEILGVPINEKLFVDSFSPSGWLCDDVLQIFRLIWKKSWKDMFMLSRGAVVSANKQYHYCFLYMLFSDQLSQCFFSRRNCC